MKLNYFKMLDKIGNNMGIVPVHMSRKSMIDDSISTGSLVCDLIIGGGWPAGKWVALFGPEQSSKSTLLYHTLRDAIRQDVNAEFFDFEGSTDPTYLGKILEMDLNRVFGVRKNIGTWEITPQCRYYQPDVGEVYFRYIHRVLKALPDKLKHKDQWFYVYDKKPTDKHNEKLYKNTGRYWVEAEDGSAQVIWFIDSLPAMLPEARDDKDESKEIGLLARMFSQNIPLVKSRLARKRCSVVAVNQIRLKPMCLYYDAKVMLSDGSEMEIGKIVEKKLKVNVLSYNKKTGQIESKPVVGWYNNGEAEKDEFKNLTVSVPRKGSRSEFGITGDHILYDVDGKEIKLKDLKEGDYVKGLGAPRFNADQMQIIYASVLGDGYLRTRNTGTELSIRHGEKQADYCIFKRNILGYSNGSYNSKNQFEFSICRKSEVLARLESESYEKNSSKTVKRILSKTLIDSMDLRGLALYYMDDGTLREYGINGSESYTISFTINKYSREQGEILKSKFDKLTGLEFKHRIGKKYHHLKTTGKENVYKFLELVSPYMDKSMKYKIGQLNTDSFATYKWDTKYLPPTLENFKISNIRNKISNIKGVKKFRYDIEVADNHTYFVQQIQVHNSFGNPEYEVGGESPKFYSDIRLQCRACYNPFGKGQLAEEPCWDGVGIDKYKYIKVSTTKNKCFSPYRNSLMRVWIEEKGTPGKGLDPFFDTYQFLKETRQAIEGKKGTITLTIPGIWIDRVWKWQELKELVLNPNKAEVYVKYELNDPEIGKIEDTTNEEVKDKLSQILDLRGRCKDQLRNDQAFELYFNAICGVGNSAEAEKTCGTCANFHKQKNCMEVKNSNKACKEWTSEEDLEFDEDESLPDNLPEESEDEGLEVDE